MADELDLENLQQAEGAAEGEILIEEDTARTAPRAAARPEGAQAAAGRKHTINALRFTKDEWMREFPDSDEEKWWMAANPDALNIFVSGTMIRMRNEKHEADVIRVIMLDDAYAAWLSENGREAGEAAAGDYAKTVSDERATELLAKDHMNVSIQFLAVPVLLQGTRAGRANFYLKKSVAEALTKYLEPFYGEGNVYVPRYILTFAGTRRLEVDYEELLRGASDWFRDGTKSVKEDLRTQRLANRVTFACIPVAVRVIHKSAVFPLGKVEKEEAAQFNPVLTLGDAALAEKLPCIEDLKYIEGYRAVPAPAILGLQRYYIQMNTVLRNQAEARKKNADELRKEDREAARQARAEAAKKSAAEKADEEAKQ